jgi:hypothetical protein
MAVFEGKQAQRKARADAATEPTRKTGSAAVRLVDNRPQAVAQRASARTAPQARDATGLPSQLKSGVEQLSGFSLDDVRVHYNSSRPAQLQAHAYAQGSNIFVASGQEQHLAHEVWHVVQQKQGRVRPTMQMAGKVNVNDDAALEREADVLGGKALRMRSQQSPVPRMPPAGNDAQPVQRRIKQENVEYSFLEAHDLDGNPYLASKAMDQEKNWKIATQQQAVRLEPVDDLHEEVTNENKGAIDHNLSMGREQRTSIGGQKSIYVPFKSYTFGPQKVPEIAVFNVSDTGAEKGMLYPQYKARLDTVLADYLSNSKIDTANTALAECKIEMLPLIGGENYRTDGALQYFHGQWTKLEQAFAQLHALRQNATPQTGRPKRGVVNAVELQEGVVRAAIDAATSKLPWAGSNGKEHFRSHQSASRGTWIESRRPVDRSGMSPERQDTGGYWKEPEKKTSQLKKKNLSSEPVRSSTVAQCRFTQGGIQYSFLAAHDFNGNPFLASEHDGSVKNWKFSVVQNGLQISAQADLHTPVNKDEFGTVYHNLSMGRQQRITVGGQKGILHPFKSYQFGVNTVPEVAVYNVGPSGVESAKLYKHYYAQVGAVVEAYLKDRDLNKATAALDKYEAEMMPLVVGEDYRTRGAVARFEKAWQTLHVALLDVAFHELAPHLKSANTSDEDEDDYDRLVRELEDPSSASGHIEASTSSNKRAKVTGRLPHEASAASAKNLATTHDEHNQDVGKLREAVYAATSGLPWAGSDGKKKFREEESQAKGSKWKESSRPVDRGGMSPSRDDTGGMWE